MKPSTFFLLTGLSTALILSACEKQAAIPEPPAAEATPAASTPTAPAPAAAPVTLDASKLLQSFASAGPEEQSRAGKAAQALQAEAYPAALDALEKLLAEGHLSPEQKELVTGFITQLKRVKPAKP